MREIRYRLARRAGASRFAPWFEADPGAVIHATDLRFEPDATRATLVAFGDARALADAMRGAPILPSRSWRVDARAPDLVVVEAAWGEPAFGGVMSPSRVAHDVFGGGAARCAFTVRHDGVTQRVLIDDERPVEPLWDALVREMDEYARVLKVDVRCELERVARRDLRPDPYDPDFLRAATVAFDLGALDQPPAATPEQVAAFLELPLKSVESYINEARTARLEQ